MLQVTVDPGPLLPSTHRIASRSQLPSFEQMMVAVILSIYCKDFCKEALYDGAVNKQYFSSPISVFVLPHVTADYALL